jgi:hypothetical protein
MRQCKVCKAKDQAIAILADEVDYLRMQLAAKPQGFIPNTPPLNPSKQPPIQVGFPPYVSDEEAEFRQLFEDGHIDEEEMKAALQAMGFGDKPEAERPIDPLWEEVG